MDFPISGTHIQPLYLMGIGFVVGILGGFFGVGGSFLAGPALFAAGVPMNFVVGTDLAHIVGKSIVAAKKHRVLGNVDIKLGMIMVVGTIAGVETGAQLIQHLKRHANVDAVVGIGFICVLVSISAFIGWESWQTLKMEKKRGARKPTAADVTRPQPVPSRFRRYLKSSRNAAVRVKKDESIIAHIPQRIHHLQLPPMVRLPNSGIARISLWAILGVAFVGGVFSGFLGGGAGYVRMPSMVYLLGVPTHVAVGTDLFEIVISASYGTLTHGVKGNVDILLALVMHTGAAIGAQIGATLTEYFHGTRIRLAFFPLPLIGAGVVIYSLVTGHHL
ncbi:sulfite exporter TauE/SafE family protein [Geobacter sp.]|uniref:sulfite exporter TauE/SafE family protein n=1 Tax=Geobacter sp. TaxID=46610 RepID=UPI00262BD2B4|nr:sulfite exporter TauE/SafE family protein [Geobacter sp.]